MVAWGCQKVGKIGGKALIYFEIVSTFALAIGLIVVNIVQPGKGFNTDATSGADVSQYTDAAVAEHGLGAFIMQIIPENVVGALANGELLPVLFSAVLFGLVMRRRLENQLNLLLNFSSKLQIFSLKSLTW